MPTIYLGDLLEPDRLGEALAAAGFEVSLEKPPERPVPGDLGIVSLSTGVTSSLRHEVNNPLTAVLGFLQLLLRRKDLSAEAMEKVQKIYEHGLRVKEILRRPEEPDA